MKIKLLVLPMSLLMVFLVFVYFLQPEWESYKENKRLVEAKEQELNEIMKNSENFSQLLAQYDQINSEDKILIKRSIPNNFLEEDFVYNLNLIAEETGVSFVESDFKIKTLNNRGIDEAEKESDNIEEAEVSLVFNGNYFQLRKALYLMENMDRLVRIKGVTFKSSENKEELTLTLTLAIFNRKSFPNFNIALKDSYLNTMLSEGLNLDLISNYREYRGNPSVFDFSGENISGKEDLFSSSNSTPDQSEDVDSLNNNEVESEVQEEVSEGEDVGSEIDNAE